MIDEKFVELIHKEIDGDLSDRERAELESFLSRNAEAQALQRDLTKMSQALTEVSAEEPPVNLKKRIMNAIPSNRYALQQKSFAQTFFPGLKFNFKYAYVFVYGLAFGIVATAAILNLRPGINASDVSGALVVNQSTEQASLLKEINLNNSNLSGTITIRTARGLVLSEINLQSNTNVDVQMQFDPEHLRFQEMKNLQTEPIQLNVESSDLQLSGNVVRCTLAFLNPTESESSLRVVVSQNGDTIADEQIIVGSGLK